MYTKTKNIAIITFTFSDLRSRVLHIVIYSNHDEHI